MTRRERLRELVNAWYAHTRAEAPTISPAEKALERTLRNAGLGAVETLADLFPDFLNSEVTVDDKKLCEALATAIAGDEVHSFAAAAGTTTNFAGNLSEVFQRLRALSVPWSKIFALIGQILPIILAGGSIQEIIAKIIAIFFPPTPGAAAMAAAKA